MATWDPFAIWLESIQVMDNTAIPYPFICPISLSVLICCVCGAECCFGVSHCCSVSIDDAFTYSETYSLIGPPDGSMWDYLISDNPSAL